MIRLILRSSAAVQRLAALAVLLATGLLALPSHADQLVPYRGEVWGAIVTDDTLKVLEGTADEVSSHLGRGKQEFKNCVIEITQDGDDVVHLKSHGLGIATAANGDQLNVEFELEGCMGADGIINYTGEYRIVPGGTGRFQYASKGADADLGSGPITGIAWLLWEDASGTWCLHFHHEFAGDLLQVGKPTAKARK
jgi:hypothetical protein